mmetsp:Transcript_8100/g.18110  ORF Transcript_8100/g.18110 Transcript_8100/m.18110 type:complete len:127 (-) Transcript_8100:64-444(-)
MSTPLVERFGKYFCRLLSGLMVRVSILVLVRVAACRVVENPTTGVNSSINCAASTNIANAAITIQLSRFKYTVAILVPYDRRRWVWAQIFEVGLEFEGKRFVLSEQSALAQAKAAEHSTLEYGRAA